MCQLGWGVIIRGNVARLGQGVEAMAGADARSRATREVPR